MLVIGLTGGIGSGKSTACAIFAALGIPVIDADLIAREVVEPGQEGLSEVVAAFGEQALTSEGGLNRPALRNRIFTDENARRRLEAILHPLIRRRIRKRLSSTQAPYAILAIPLLVENGQTDLTDRILVIDVTAEQQIARTCGRDGIPEAQARAILATQCSRAERLAAANDVIFNQGSLTELKAQIEGMHRYFLDHAKQNQYS